MRVRLRDIAEDLKLSKMTISKVLRGQMDISDATKARVLKRVKELNYIPNISASSLRTGQTKTVGLVLPSVGTPHFSDLTAGVTHALNAQGYSLIVSCSRDNTELEPRQVEVFLSLQVDALLVVSQQEAEGLFEQLKSTKELPVIFIGSRPSGVPGRFVGIQEKDVGRIACEHLMDMGCKRVAYIRGPHSAVGDRRCNGYREALRARGIAVQSDLIVENMNPEESEYQRGYEAMDRLLSRRVRLDGVMSYTDLLAVGAMDAASRHGVRIPEELRVVGCGDDPPLCRMRIPLTSIDIGGRELGEYAGKLALRAINSGRRDGGRNCFVKPKLVKRRSSEISR